MRVVNVEDKGIRQLGVTEVSGHAALICSPREVGGRTCLVSEDFIAACKGSHTKAAPFTQL
jgi:hypothetical protein